MFSFQTPEFAKLAPLFSGMSSCRAANHHQSAKGKRCPVGFRVPKVFQKERLMNRLSTYADLLKTLQGLSEAQLAIPVSQQLTDHNGQAIFCPSLSFGLNQASTADSDVAIQICALSDIRLVQSQDEETLNRWDWIDNTIGNASDVSFDFQFGAAVNAVKLRYPLADWQFEIESGNTTSGYWDWALQKAHSDADDRNHL